MTAMTNLLALTHSENRMNPNAPVSILEGVGNYGGVVPESTGAATNNANAFEQILAYAVSEKRALIIPAGQYYFSRSVVVPADWRSLVIRGEFSGSPVPGLASRGTRLLFPGTDGIRINLTTNTHEQIHISGLCISNSLGTDPTYNKGGSPSGIFIYIDDARTFNYPNDWFFDDLGFEGLTNAFAIVRRRASGSLGAIDPNGFFGRFEARRLHTYRTDNSFYLEAVNPNLFSVDVARFHVGGTVYIAGSGCNASFSNCHWEDADTSWFRISPTFFDSFVALHNCRGELNGDYVGDVAGVPFHNKSFVRFDAGSPDRTINFTLTGDCQMPGYGEYAPELPSGVSIANYGNLPITVDPNGGTIVTPHSVRVRSPADDANFIRHFYMPEDAGCGGRRNSLPQTPSGIRGSGAAGVNINFPPKHEKFPTVTSSETAWWYGASVPRTPDVTGTDQMFVITTAGSFNGGDQFSTRWKPGNSSVTISGTTTNWTPPNFMDRTGRYVCVVMIYVGSGDTLDELLMQSPASSLAADYGGYLAVGYGCWHKANKDLYAADLRHPLGFEWGMQLTVANSGSTEIPFRSGATTPFGFSVEAQAGTGRCEYVFNGVAGNAATKYQVAKYPDATSGSGITFTAGDGSSANDMGSLTIANASGATVNCRVTFRF
jgi:hypothetical protein